MITDKEFNVLNGVNDIYSTVKSRKAKPLIIAHPIGIFIYIILYKKILFTHVHFRQKEEDAPQQTCKPEHKHPW